MKPGKTAKELCVESLKTENRCRHTDRSCTPCGITDHHQSTELQRQRLNSERTLTNSNKRTPVLEFLRIPSPPPPPPHPPPPPTPRRSRKMKGPSRYVGKLPTRQNQSIPGLLPNTGHQKNIPKQFNQKQISVPHLIFHRLTVRCCFVA